MGGLKCLDDGLAVERQQIDDVGEICERLDDLEYLANFIRRQSVDVVDDEQEPLSRFDECL